ncbi:TraX protein [Aerococcus urinae]|uniref:TraX protein n=1 Tax=Aerococcus urinae TaxID=1376 RepID=UPI0018E1A52D|nr:TraX protein [Aerococcus urinae]
MNKSRRQALLMTALSLIYATYQLQKPADQLTGYHLFLGHSIPIVATIFALNEKKAGLKWTLVAINLILLAIMVYVFWMS